MEKDISSDNLIRHCAKFFLHRLQQRLNLNFDKRNKNIWIIMYRRRSDLTSLMFFNNNNILSPYEVTYALCQFLHIFWIGVIADGIILLIFRFNILFNVSHPLKSNPKIEAYDKDVRRRNWRGKEKRNITSLYFTQRFSTKVYKPTETRSVLIQLPHFSFPLSALQSVEIIINARFNNNRETVMNRTKCVWR